MAATKAEFFEREFGELSEKAAVELLGIPLAAVVAGAAEDALHDMYVVILADAALRFLVGFAGSRTSLVRSRTGSAVSEPAAS